jgi:hypothetical protein
MMSKFISYRFRGSELTLTEWFLYTYIVSSAWHKDSDDGSIKRGQTKFNVRELSELAPKSTIHDLLRSLVNKGLIHKGYFRNCKKLGLLLTVSNYDSVNSFYPDKAGQYTGQYPDSEVIDNKSKTNVSKTIAGQSNFEVRTPLFEEVEEVVSFNKLKETSSGDSKESDKPKKTRKHSKPKEHTPAFRVWTAYAEAHKVRYQPKDDKPLFRPAYIYKVINTMLEQVDEEELIKRVKYYVEKFNDSKIVEAKHPLSWLDARMNEITSMMKFNSGERHYF